MQHIILQLLSLYIPYTNFLSHRAGAHPSFLGQRQGKEP